MKNLPNGMRFSWDDKTIGVSVLMGQITQGQERLSFLAPAEKYCDDVQNNKKVLVTPMGLLYLDEWGPIRYAMNSATVCLLTSDITR